MPRDISKMDTLKGFALIVICVLPIKATQFPPFQNLDVRKPISTNLPGSWTSQGCYTDVPGARTLGAAGYASTAAMSVESCISFCDNQLFVYAGVEYGQECYCDNYIQNNGTPVPLSECSTPCTGDQTELCGAGFRLNLFFSGKSPPAGPIIVPGVGKWVSLGCYSDSAASRTLGTGLAISDMTIENCTDACYHAGFPLAGAEYGRECFCGLAFGGNGAPTPLVDCNMACTGNSSQICGGPNRLAVYNFTGTLPTTPPGGGGGGGVSPVTTGLPKPWSYAACYVDNAHGRIFEYQSPDNTSLTVEGCISTCTQRGFTLSGMEYSVQCFCGNHLVAGAVIAAEGECNMGCGGAPTEACGGPNRVSVYTATGEVVALPVPTVLTDGLPGQWQYQGCLKEPGAKRVFPYQNTWTNNNTVQACLNQCAMFGFPAAGMEFGTECWCGDVSDETNNGGVPAPEQECTLPCSGDPLHICGGAERLQLYHWKGDLNVWHTPANTGRYEFFVPGVIVPLIATLGLNNKVTFLEKFGTGFPNSTGAYELDPSLVGNWESAWRPMHVKSDVFCSASIILPDKAGRQINVGGWSLESTFGVRLYTPDGSPGHPSVNDWEENFEVLKLQRGRWYPTALIMANGSILVVGGESGSNAPPQPNLEILPTPAGGDTVVDLDFLRRTDPFSLYPFLFVLPSGRIFIGYYNEARILDQTTFHTVTTLPNIPGSVNNFYGGRTYPLEGAAMSLPQHAPYTDPLQILICGGSTPFGGSAIDNCVTIAPEAPNPQWIVERMPSRRVMPCMVALPDGTFMIMNGAMKGEAGFGLAEFPNLSALLYDPTQPVGQRISILNTTIVARLYHSEAILLPDGRVLVSGSDPETNNPDGTPKYPEEFRIEVYIPPYLNEGFQRPSYLISETDWSYNKPYAITVQIHQGNASNMRVSLIAATSSTHGNTMGGRTIFPAVSCSEQICTITAPPNAFICPPGWYLLFVLDGPTPSTGTWVRIGGDPAELGNWPPGGFTRPGV